MAIDTFANSSNRGNIYLCYVDYLPGADKQYLTDVLRVTRSTDGSATWANVSASQSGAPVQEVQGCMPTVGPGGQVYLGWWDASKRPNRLYIRRSDDGGVSWLQPRLINADVILDGTFVECSGSLTNVLNGFVRTGEVPAQAVNPANGHVYFAWESGKSPDIFFSRSVDEGMHWSRAVRVHANARNDQFQPRVAVSDDGTMIKVIFYDRSADPANWFIHVREATSRDDGLTWSDRVIDTAPGVGFGVPPLRPNFDPQSSDCYMGDYNALKTSGNTFYRAGGDNRNDTSRYRHGPHPPHPDPDVLFARSP